MSRVRLTILVLCLFSVATARAADGGVHLYLQPLPPEAARLTFAITSIAVVSTTGAEYPLELNLKAVDRAEASRQRRLASGHLPPGSYAGFNFVIGRAALKAPHGEVSLNGPERPVRVGISFVVTREQSPFFWFTLEYPESVTGDVDFNPAFSVITPAKPIVDHAGFVTDSASSSIIVFDKNLAQAVAAIDTCAGPAGMALDPHRRRLYVACSQDDEIQAIDVATGAVVERTRMSPGDRPRELALTPDGITLLSVNQGSDSITLFDAVSLSRHERINVAGGPTSLLVERTGRRAFVFSTLSNSVSIVDIPSRSVAATISTEAAPLRGQFNRRGDRLFVIHERSPYMTVLDPRTLTIVAKARVRNGTSAIALDSVRDLVCLGGPNETTIEFYDSNALMPLYSMKTGTGASHLAFDPEEHTLYIVSPEARGVVVARLSDRRVASRIDVGEKPSWVIVMGEK